MEMELETEIVVFYTYRLSSSPSISSSSLSDCLHPLSPLDPGWRNDRGDEMASPKNEGFLTEERRETLRLVPQNAEVLSSLPTSPGKMGIHDFQSKGGGGSRNRAAGVWHMRRTHSGKLVQVMKDGAGGKGTWGKLLDSGPDSRIDSHGPNYDSGEEPYQLEGATVFNRVDDYKKSIAIIIEEYFSACDIELATTELRDLDSDEYHHLFVKKLASMAMDRHDKEK